MNTRRDILRHGLAGAALTALPLSVRAQSAGVSAREIAPGVTLLSGAGGNVLAASNGDSVTMVDAGRADRADALLGAVASAFPNQNVSTLINTHWHPDQTGANAALGEAGATIAAHANTRLWMTAEVEWPWAPGAVIAPSPEAALPTRTFYNDPIEIGGARAGYMLQAHTDGDAWVYFPDADVLACGGAICGDRWPEIDWWTGGWLGGVVESIETLMQVAGPDTVIVPSDGPPIDYAELERQREMWTALFLHFRDELLFKGLSPEEAAAEKPTADYRPEWGDPDPFVIRAYQSLWPFYAPDV